MPRTLVYGPSDEAIDKSLGAREYLEFLSARMDLERRPYPTRDEPLVIEGEFDSVCVLTGLSSLQKISGYMEMDLDTIFEPRDLLDALRDALPPTYLIVAVVDDSYSQYLMQTYLKAGASAVVGTAGDLFGMVTGRLSDIDLLLPYINAYARV
jgi:hypothetical protein